MRKFTLNTALLVICGLSIPARAQFFNLPGNYFFELQTETRLSKKDSSLHQGLKPYVQFFAPAYFAPPEKDTLRKFLTRKLFYEHLVMVKDVADNFSLRIDPLINFEAGKDQADTAAGLAYTNTRGFIAAGEIGSRFYFETLFAENQSVFPRYIDRQVSATTVVPGQGRWKSFKQGGYDYAFSSGFVSWQVVKNVNLQAGHGKQKVGHGYRSLLLSDNALNYPYLRITQQWFKGRLQYTNIYAVFMNLQQASVRRNPFTERLFQKKPASFQHLSINPARWLNIGFFQGLIWPVGDEKNRHRPGFEYYNPLIFANYLHLGPDSRKNLLVGAEARIKATADLNLYGQVMQDSKQVNRKGYGCQGGMLYYNAFGLKQLTLQYEYNSVSNGSYLSPDPAHNGQSYTHYGQWLSSMPGPGTEHLAMVHYRYKRAFAQVKINRQDHTGGNTVGLTNAGAGLVINPAYNLNLSTGLLLRTEKISNFSAVQTRYLYLSLRTSLYNFYYDF